MKKLIALLLISAQALAANQTGPAYTVLRMGSTNNAPAKFGAVDLAQPAATTNALPISRGGTGAATKAAAFDALSPLTTGGDLLVGGASGTGQRLANGSAGQTLIAAGGTSAPSWTSGISARYHTAAAQALVSNTATIVNFETADYDTSSAVTTGSNWKFTAPMAGKYRVSFLVLSGNISWSQNEQFTGSIFKNGSAITNDTNIAQVGALFRMNSKTTDLVSLALNDYIDIRITQGGHADGLVNDATAVWVAIDRVSN